MTALSANKIADAIETVVDKVEEIQLDLSEKTGDMIKGIVKIEAVEDAVNSVLDFHKEIVEGTHKSIKSVSRSVADGIDSLLGIEKEEEDLEAAEA